MAMKRIGIDLGGSKIEGIILDSTGEVRARERIAAPRESYEATLDALEGLIRRLGADAGPSASVGIGMPGSISPATGLVQNANSTWLNGRPLDRDLSARLGRPLRFSNDANCFALSEAVDGAGAGHSVVFGVILGTGCGGGIVHDGKLFNGARRIGGEWGHTTLPWAEADEHPGPACWCGLKGCVEMWVSGPALEADYRRATSRQLSARRIAEEAAAGEPRAAEALDRHARRLARGLAAMTNILDPDVIVLGGGLSQLSHLYEALPPLMSPYIFADNRSVLVKPPKWGDASGARGAAWLSV
jgi:fructokinase